MGPNGAMTEVNGHNTLTKGSAAPDLASEPANSFRRLLRNKGVHWKFRATRADKKSKMDHHLQKNLV